MGFETVQILSLVIGVVLPLLVGWVTKESWGSGLKAWLLALFSGISGFLSTWLDAINGGLVFDWRVTLLTVLGTFLVAIGLHVGIWKPTGATAVVQRSGIKD